MGVARLFCNAPNAILILSLITDSELYYLDRIGFSSFTILIVVVTGANADAALKARNVRARESFILFVL